MVHNVGRQNLAALVVGDVALHDSYTGINDALGGFGLDSTLEQRAFVFELGLDPLADIGGEPLWLFGGRCGTARSF